MTRNNTSEEKPGTGKTPVATDLPVKSDGAIRGGAGTVSDIVIVKTGDRSTPTLMK
jgi:hypothetical protein